jgi:hypothetical protein
MYRVKHEYMTVSNGYKLLTTTRAASDWRAKIATSRSKISHS